ncbi:armadillo-type protein [Tribonema minus]|uniref:Exportin-T n=1 Tax=Tribonema minus TaxID=303371 RepID=A0A836CAL0_9STRA|nr:armadillo-type protein [Tribonema minus]
MPFSPQEVEMAVLYAMGVAGGAASSDDAAAALRQQASQFCDEVKASPEGWVVALQLFSTTTRPEARFYALMVLQDALGARPGAACRLTDPEHRQRVRECLLGWLTSPGVALADVEKYIVTKVGVVLALLLRADFPERWPHAFTQLAALLPRGPAHVGLFLRFLGAVDEDVVRFNAQRSPEEVERNTLVKDAMRGTGVPADVARVVFTTVTTYRADLPELAAFALESLSKLIGWIDIALVVNDKMLQLLYDCLERADGGPELAQAAAACLEEVVLKGIADNAEKLRVLQSLRLVSVLNQLPTPADEDVAAKVSQLVSSLIEQLLILTDRAEGTPQAAPAAALLSDAMPLLWAYMAHPDVTVAQNAVEAANHLVSTLKRQQLRATAAAAAAGGAAAGASAAAAAAAAPGAFNAMDHAPRLLSVVYARMQFPADFEFDAEDEEDGEEEALRGALRKVLVNTCRAAPELVLRFACEALSALPSPLSALPWPAAEAALRLLYHFSEGCASAAAAANAQALLHEGAFPQMVAALHRSDIARHPHPQVLILYFDIAVRYVKVLRGGGAELTPLVLEALCSERGLSNASRLVRARAAYNLSRLVKALAGDMVPYVEAVVPAVAALLRSGASQGLLSDESVLNLYETLGCLVGMPAVPAERRVAYLEGVLAPLLARVHEALAQPQAIAQDPEAAGAALAFCLAGLANVSKGFTKPLPEAVAPFTQELEAAAAVLLALPDHPGVRARAIFLVHRMVPVLGEGMLPRVGPACAALVARCTGADLEEIVQLLNQFCVAFGPKAFAFMDAMLLPLIRKIYDLMPPPVPQSTAAGGAASGGGGGAGGGTGGLLGGGGGAGSPLQSPPEPLSHEVLERTALLKQYLSFLTHVVSDGMLGVLCSAANAPQLDAVLQSVLDTLAQVDDPVAKKSCIAAFAAMAKELAPDARSAPALPPAAHAGLQSFVLERAVPAAISCLLSPGLNVKDANAIGAVNQVGQLLFLARRLQGGGAECVRAALQQQQQVACPAHSVEQLLGALASAEDAQTMSKSLRGFAAQLRRNGGTGGGAPR